MKKILCILLIGFTISSFAQDRKREHKKSDNDFTVEQKTTLKVKKMTLALDLTEGQQKQVETVFLKGAKEMDKMKAQKMKWTDDSQKPTSDQKFAMHEQFLNHQIKVQNEMKRILKPEQYAAWKKMREKGNRKMMMKKKQKSHRQSQKMKA